MAGLKKMIRNRLNRDTVYASVEFWNEKAVEYTGDKVSMWANSHLNALYDAEQKYILRQFATSIEIGGHILDLGCGTGRITRFMADLGYQLTGMDFSQATIDIAGQLTAGGNPEYKCASYLDMPTNVKYAGVISIGSITLSCRNQTELTAMFKIIRNVLPENGCFILIEPIHRGFLHRVCNLNLSEFLHVLGNSGFEVKEVVELHFWPSRLLLSYIPIPRAITRMIYRGGQWFLHGLFRNLSMGDYKAILAVRKDYK